MRAYRADLASLAEVRALADAVLAAEPGSTCSSTTRASARRPGRRAAHGERRRFELRFAVNYLAGYLLTHRLLDLLRASAPARIVNVASAGQMALDFDDLMLERDYSGVRAYCQSKLAQILFTFELAESSRVAASPSTLPAPRDLHADEDRPPPVSTLEEGVEATFALVAGAALGGVSGRYFNGTRESRADPQAHDPDARRRLDEISRRLVA